MDKKKIITFSVIAAFLVLIAVILYIFNNAKPSPGETPVNNGNSTTISQPVSIPEDTNLPASNISSEEIKKKFSESVNNSSRNIADQSTTWSKIQDNNNKPVPLSQFSSSVGMNVNQNLIGLLDNGKYEVFSCTDKNEKMFGLYLSEKLAPDNTNIYVDVKNIMASWEKTLFKDVAKVIYPNVSFTDSLLSQNTSFVDREGSYRVADVVLPGNKKGVIAYTIVDDYIVISSSFFCLTKASGELVSNE